MIHSGHRLSDVLNYTLAQMNAFLAAELRRDHEHAGLLLAVTAVACKGDKRGIERLRRQLASEE